MQVFESFAERLGPTASSATRSSKAWERSGGCNRESRSQEVIDATVLANIVNGIFQAEPTGQIRVELVDVAK
jgi:hypothetical protein